MSPAACAVQHPEALDGWHSDGHCSERRERERHDHDAFHLVALVGFLKCSKVSGSFHFKFKWKATSSSSAGSTARIFEPEKSPKFPLTVVPNFAVRLTSPCCYGSTLSPGLPTLLVSKTESWWASWLDACCLFPHKYISISSSSSSSSSLKTRGNTRLSIVLGERLRWRGWGSPRHEGGGEKTEWTGERKARGGEEEGRIEQRERQAILQTCDTLIINKLGLNA